MTYFYQHKAAGVCPKCQAPANVEEIGSANGDWVEAQCTACKNHESLPMEAAGEMLDRWSAELPDFVC